MRLKSLYWVRKGATTVLLNHIATLMGNPIGFKKMATMQYGIGLEVGLSVKKLTWVLTELKYVLLQTV